MSKLFLWDWAGTLADEARLDKAVCLSMEEGIALKRGIPVAEAARVFREHLKGMENRWEWHDYLEHARKFGLDWRVHQEKHLNSLRLLPDARFILGYAKKNGYRNILTTNAVRKVIFLRVGHLRILNLFDAIVASDDVGALKGEGRHFSFALEIMKGRPEGSFSVGNNPSQDILPAKKIGLRTIYCDFGSNLTHYHSTHLTEGRSRQVEADFMVKNLREIKNIIESND